MVCAGNFEWIPKHTRGIIVIVSSRITLTPSGKRFPTIGHNDLFAPVGGIGRKPLLFHPLAVRIEAELPRAVKVHPVVAFDCSSLEVGSGIFRAWVKEMIGHRIKTR